MFEKLKRLFAATLPEGGPSDRGGARGPAAAAPPAAGPQARNASPDAVWRTPTDPQNPFVVAGCDCAAFTGSMISTTSDPAIAQSFTGLRGDDGRRLEGRLPADAVALECRLDYSAPQTPADGPLFKAAAMEEKWDIYVMGGRLYCARSWTGELGFVGEFMHAEGRLVVSRVWASPAAADLAVRQLDFLVKSHLLGRIVPHPLPPELGQDVQRLALYSFSQYGRLCWFGTFEDTLVDGLRKPVAGEGGTATEAVTR